jgi:hypothetical protein
VQGSLADSESAGRTQGAAHASNTIFSPIWESAVRAASSVYDAASFQVLVERYRTALGNHAPDYSI